jgi:uncharacterized protein (TIGR03437 family)
MRKLCLTGMIMAASLFGASSVLDFTLNSLDGKLAALANYRAALNQDNRYNAPSNPAAKGSYVSLCITGEGQTAPAGVTGKITTLSPTPPLTPQPLLPVECSLAANRQSLHSTEKRRARFRV